MIASQAVRAAPVRRAVHPRPRHTAHVTRAAVRAHPRGSGATWEMRSFVAVSAAIAFVFVLAMLYLAQTTTVSARGYQAQRLEQTLAEVRRQNALLEVEIARLDAPARIDAEARKIGLVRIANSPVVRLEPIQASTVKR